MQDAYRPPRIKYSICCPIPGGGGHSIPDWAGDTPSLDGGGGGTPSLDGGYPIPGQGGTPSGPGRGIPSERWVSQKMGKVIFSVCL